VGKAALPLTPKLNKFFNANPARADFMPTKRTPEERHHWSLITERMGQQLKECYRACTAEELPPLLTLLKKLDQELPEERDQ
jgi:hypothetical protein